MPPAPDALEATISQHYAIDLDSTSILDRLVKRSDESFDSRCLAFIANIDALINIASLPIRLAITAEVDKVWQSISTAERIRSLKLVHEQGETDEHLEVRRSERSSSVSQERFTEELKDPDRLLILRSSAMAFLLRDLEDLDAVKTASLLIQQGFVLCWSAIEILARDCFEQALNQDIGLVKQLLSSKSLPKVFQLQKMVIEDLSDFDYDLSRSMGSLLIKNQDLSDILTIRAAYKALFPEDAALRLALNNEALRLLSLRRNLIVHRQGIVDETYILKSACTTTVGSRLPLAPSDLAEAIQVSVQAAEAILNAVSGASNKNAPVH